VEWVAFTPTARNGTVGAPQTNPAYVDIEIRKRVINQSDKTQTRLAPGAKNAIVMHEGVELRNFSL
jgi:hypothetical protein